MFTIAGSSCNFDMTMKASIVLIGIGELGGEFARGFLRCGHPVYPITREMALSDAAELIPTPGLVLITVQESELDGILKELPESWRDKIGLVQNELLPRHWQRHGIDNPTVAVVWFEKKPGMALTNILYTPVYGPRADVLMQALEAIDIPTRLQTDEDQLLFELLRKSLYIMTVNICGLSCGGTVGGLWMRHHDLVREVALESVSILEWLSGRKLPAEKLIAGMIEGFEDCPDRNCLGRSARFRLERALQYAGQAGLKTPRLDEIYRQVA